MEGLCLDFLKIVNFCLKVDIFVEVRWCFLENLRNSFIWYCNEIFEVDVKWEGDDLRKKRKVEVNGGENIVLNF